MYFLDKINKMRHVTFDNDRPVHEPYQKVARASLTFLAGET